MDSYDPWPHLMQLFDVQLRIFNQIGDAVPGRHDTDNDGDLPGM